MAASRKKHLTSATFSYWFLLVYIIAALVWWFISLQQQSDEIASLELKLLHAQNTDVNSASYQQTVHAIQEQQQRAHAKYVGEGTTFLILTLIGAFFVYRSVRRQIRLQQQEKNFMMAITHELKTPIAISKLNLETLQKHKLDEMKQQKLIAMTLQETERLNVLTNNILVSSQLEGGRYKRTEEELDLSALIISAFEDFRHRFHERTWESEVEPEIAVDGDPLLLQILMNNLLENAIKYSPKDSTIKVSLKRSSNAAKLQVCDNGIGISNDEKSFIFEKFYRIGNEETRKTTGTGLGLYLCKIIAEEHYADIKVSDNNPAGSIFTVTFHKLKSD